MAIIRWGTVFAAGAVCGALACVFLEGNPTAPETQIVNFDPSAEWPK